MGVTLEQVVTVRLHLKRETIQDMNHWACGWEGGRVGMTLEQVVTVRLHLQRETIQDMSYWACGWMCGREGGCMGVKTIGFHAQILEHLTSKSTYYIFQL